jgi:quinoprotein glucose dehydrogenase
MVASSPPPRRSGASTACGIVLILIGLVLAVGGVWLVSLGGSGYYLVAALGCWITAVLLLKQRTAAWWAYALLLVGTLVWALWEAGLAWWPLAARLDVWFVIGLVL